MPLLNVPVGYLATIVGQPANPLPILLLIFQEDPFVFEVLSDFDHDVAGIIHLAADIECLYRVGNIPDGILLSLTILDWEMGIVIVLLNRQQVNSAFRQFIQDRRRSLFLIG